MTQRADLAAQPWLGVGGLLLGAVVFFALALGLGSTEASLLVLGPMATFALPAVAMIAFWWNDWPGSELTTPWTGLIDTVLVVGAAVVLTIAGQAIVERSDLRGVFEPSTGVGIPTTFPATLALAGAAFTAMLQLSLVCQRWPLAGLGRLRSGLAALALSWGVGVGAYFLFVNLDAAPAAERAVAGLRNPGGPIPAPDFGSALIAVGVWQAVFFIALRGWPVNLIGQQGRRLLAGNILVVGLGAATYLLLRDGAGLQSGTISAVCGCIISAAIIVGMLFEGWPVTRLAPGPGHALTLVLTAAVAVALNRALAAYADGVAWGRATPDDWVTTAALSFIGAGIILHVGIGLRWRGNYAGRVAIGDGRKIYLECRGTGSPTVVLVSGLDSAADVWSGYQARPALAVFARVARFARVCAYDRPGTPVGDKLKPSRSTAVRQPTTAQNAVTDLHALLEAAGEPGPYILVGHSYGGLITRIYASEYPSETAGLVFVDAFAPQWKSALTSRQWHILKAITGPSKLQLTEYPEIERINFDRSVAQARAVQPPRCSLPVVVVSRDTHTPPGDFGPMIASEVAQGKLPAFVRKDFGYIDDRAWDKAQVALAGLVPHARHVVVTSGHNIQIGRPRVVTAAIHEVVGTARQQRGRISRIQDRCSRRQRHGSLPLGARRDGPG